MANGVPCKVCQWTETAHDMAKKYRKRRWYWWCLHKYIPESGKKPRRR